jgi:hypothetical protein
MDPGAPRSAVDAACRGALVALRPALEILCVDLSDLPWPDEATRALVTLEPRRRKRWLFKRAEPHITADLMVTDDVEFEAALSVVPYTICATGITHDGIDAYNADDSGSSQWFLLTEDELKVARNWMIEHGENPAYLIPAQPGDVTRRTSPPRRRPCA